MSIRFHNQQGIIYVLNYWEVFIWLRDRSSQEAQGGGPVHDDLEQLGCQDK